MSESKSDGESYEVRLRQLLHRPQRFFGDFNAANLSNQSFGGDQCVQVQSVCGSRVSNSSGGPPATALAVIASRTQRHTDLCGRDCDAFFGQLGDHVPWSNLLAERLGDIANSLCLARFGSSGSRLATSPAVEPGGFQGLAYLLTRNHDALLLHGSNDVSRPHSLAHRLGGLADEFRLIDLAALGSFLRNTTWHG
jgi:hypothetical protein